MECGKRIGPGEIFAKKPKSFKAVGRWRVWRGCHYSIKIYGRVGRRAKFEKKIAREKY